MSDFYQDIKEDDWIWVKTRVGTVDREFMDEYPDLILESVTLWTFDDEKHRKRSKPGDYIEQLEQVILKQDKALEFYAEKADGFDGYPNSDYGEVCSGNFCVEVLGKLARQAREETKEVVEEIKNGSA
jgi:hypothetical protein